MTASFVILPGLPGEGPYPEQFTNAGGTHREGFVVQIVPESGEPWVGNFQRGHGTLTRVVAHPGGRLLLVIARGLAYPVDTETRRMVGPPTDAITGACQSAGWVALASFTGLVVFGPDGERWQTPQVAWDGIEDLRIEGNRLFARGWNAILEQWEPIEIDLETHQVLKHAFEGPDLLTPAPPRRGLPGRVRSRGTKR
jgi:hypothetical protein